MPKCNIKRKTSCRKLYEKHVAAEKQKLVVTLDEAWVYLTAMKKDKFSIVHLRGMTARNSFVSAQKNSQKDS